MMMEKRVSGKQMDGKVAIITGAGQGIGEAIARAYVAQGSKVLLTGQVLGVNGGTAF